MQNAAKRTTAKPSATAIVTSVVVVFLSAIGSVVVFRGARAGLHLVNLATPREKFLGTVTWLVTFGVGLIASTIAGFRIAPAAPIPFLGAGVALGVAAAGSLWITDTLAEFLLLLSSLTMLLAGALGTRTGAIDDRGAGYVAFAATAWIVAASLHLLFTWALVFFE